MHRGGPSREPLRNPAFRRLWWARTVSGAGDALVPVTLAFAVLGSRGSPSDLGLVLAAGMVGQVVFVLVGGVWADRVSRIGLLIGTDLVEALTYGVLAVLLLAHEATVWQLALGRGIAGVAAAFFMPASGAVVLDLVPKAQLQQANALLGLSRSVAQVGGPALAGILVAVANPGVAFAVNAASFVGSAALLSRLRLPARAVPRPRRSFRTELAEGWGALWSRPWYPVNLLAHASWSFAIAFFLVLGPVITSRGLGGAAAWGVISAGVGAGLVVGGLIALRWQPHRPLVVGNLALVLAVGPVLGLSVPLSAWAIAGLAVVAYAGLAFLNEVWGAVVGNLYPSDILGRIESYDWLVSIIAMPAGYALAGPVAAALGNRTALVLAAALIAVPSLAVCLLRGVRSVQRLPDGALVEGFPSTVR